MKPDIAHTRSRSQRHTERLNRPIQVLVVNGIFIMPDSRGRICDLIADESNAIGSGSGLDLGDRRPSPGLNCRLRLHRGRGGRKGETGGAADSESTVGDIVVLVALRWISLAPDVLMWSDVLTFGEVGGARILSCV